jgi:predicted dehydrogenase
MIKIGVIGAGHLGKIHLKILKNLPEFELVGLYDKDPDRAKAVAEELEVPAFDKLLDLVNVVDAVDIVTPTLAHYEVASQSIRRSKHVFIEKPVTHTVDEARKLVALVREAGVVAQVGHVERFNAAFLAVKHLIDRPMFIEIHRLALWNPRGTDVSVVHDLMIHDLDVVQHIVGSPIRSFSASGVGVITDTPDIANVRLEFHNGCVANLTASRISLKNMRKMRIFQKSAYLSIDFLDRKAEVVRIFDPSDAIPEGLNTLDVELDAHRSKKLAIEVPDVPAVNAIELELKEFARAINTRQDPAVSIYDATEALQTAHAIAERIAQQALA